MSAATTTRSRTTRATRTPVPDRLCAEAVDLARSAAEEAAAPGVVGEHVGVVSDRVVTHYFEAKEPGYRGWRWAVTVARASRAKNVTLDETVLLPGADALLAPEWVPWSERLRPGDMGPGTCCRPSRRTCAWSRAGRARTSRRRDSVVSEELAELVDSEDAELTDRPVAATSRGSIAAVAEELGTRRARVLSRYGLYEAADRWDEAFGPKTPMAQAAPATCVSCAFLIPMAGSLKRAFWGVRERVRSGGRACGVAGVRVRWALGGRGDAEAGAAGGPRAGHDAGGRVRVAAGAGEGSVPAEADGASEDLGHS